MEFRLRYPTIALAAGALVAGGLGLWSRYREPYRPALTHHLVRLPRAHAGLAGLTIAFITDTHVGPHFSGAALEPTIRLVEQVMPDVVLFGGDYISESPRFLAEVEAPLTRMAQAARLGSWAVLGNHDIANVRRRVSEMLARTPIRLLTNESVSIVFNGQTLWLTGIDDALLGQADLRAAFADVPPGAANLTLWHEADRVDEVLPYAPFLMLSGHSHGGQVRLPLLGPLATPKLGKRYVMGRFELENTTLYVSRGIGMYRPPVRFRCPPEVPIFTLVAP